ncbi:MAG: DUF4258 domain-containing protein [Fimbriimonadaceae bacterium]|nr:DUF4258 domain-containing protein [Fimbriimonadaceae bacterium]
MQYVLSSHATDALKTRNIHQDWLERVLNSPSRTVPDFIDSALEHRLGIIAEHDNRVLRVIVNIECTPVRVVTAYFDRTMRGTL